MRTKATSRRVGLFGVILFVSLQATSAHAQDCTYSLDPVELEVKTLLAKIQEDPFREGLTEYSEALTKVANAQDEWVRRAEDGNNNTCKPYTSDMAQYEADVQNYNGRCAGTLPEAAYNQCMSERGSLLNRKAALDARSKEMDSSLATLNAGGQEILKQAISAVEPAREILDPQNTEKAFWLLAHSKWSDVNENSLTDCEAMAQLYGALVKRVRANPGDIALYSGQVLANGVGYRDITVVARGTNHVDYGQDGFRPQYQDDDPNSQNQVRHFAGYFVLGLKYPSRAQHADIVTYIRDTGQTADIALGITAASMGQMIANDPSRIRFLEGTIRSTICH